MPTSLDPPAALHGFPLFGDEFNKDGRSETPDKVNWLRAISLFFFVYAYVINHAECEPWYGLQG